MDILEKRTMEISTLAMDGLAARHKAISSNIANAGTPGYEKTSVDFEDQLKKILVSQQAKENFQQVKDPSNYSDFKPVVQATENSAAIGSVNSVNIEMEMAELAKNGMKYNALAKLQSKAFKGLQAVIKGGGGAG